MPGKALSLLGPIIPRQRPVSPPRAALDTTVVEAVPSVSDRILAARKAPEEVAQLIATQTEQLTVPVYKRPPDGAFWRVRMARPGARMALHRGMPFSTGHRGSTPKPSERSANS
jgi:hypothetical protein